METKAGSEKSTAPLISVVIPAYNHEKFIGAAMDSVLQQSHRNLEVVVVDDGSTDRTAEVVLAYDDSRIRYYHQENQDAYNTINRGISLAKGEYISILNSDDRYTVHRLEKLLSKSLETGAQCLFTDVIPIDAEENIFTDPLFGWNVWHRKNREVFFAEKDLYTAFLHGNFMVTTSNIFMTAKAARRVGDFAPLRYLHDYDYIFRLLLSFAKEVQYLSDEKLLYYRIHSGNTLGEAAILGREQDQNLILNYMAESLPLEYQNQVTIAGKRLITLGDELHEVKRQMAGPTTPVGVRASFANLKMALKIWLKKQIQKR